MYSFNAVKSSERSGFYQAGVFIYHTAVESVAVMKSRLLYWSCRLWRAVIYAPYPRSAGVAFSTSHMPAKLDFFLEDT